MNKKRIIKIAVAAFSMICLCCLVSGCQVSQDDSNNTYDNGKLSSIKVGDKLPNVLVSNLGLGELQKEEKSSLDLDSIEVNTKDSNFLGREIYKNPKGNKEFIVSHWSNNSNLTLEEFTRSKVVEYGMSLTNYKIDKSSVYARANHNITDGYYVTLYKEKNNNVYLVQQSTFQDGNNFVVLSYLYKCENTLVNDTKVALCIPVPDEANIDEHPYGAASKRYSYEDKTEIPIITYYETHKTLDEALGNYKSSYNAVTDKNVINGIECGIAKEPNANMDNNSFNMITCFIPNGNSLVAIELREPTSTQTLAFDALFNGIHMEK